MVPTSLCSSSYAFFFLAFRRTSNPHASHYDGGCRVRLHLWSSQWLAVIFCPSDRLRRKYARGCQILVIHRCSRLVCNCTNSCEFYCRVKQYKTYITASHRHTYTFSLSILLLLVFYSTHKVGVVRTMTRADTAHTSPSYPEPFYTHPRARRSELCAPSSAAAHRSAPLRARDRHT